jgi:hypothetical protein
MGDDRKGSRRQATKLAQIILSALQELDEPHPLTVAWCRLLTVPLGTLTVRRRGLTRLHLQRKPRGGFCGGS